MPPIIRIVPPLWFFAFLLAASALHFGIPETQVFDISNPLIGTLFLVAGFALSLYASGLFKKENTEILPGSETNRVLITYGVFSYSRNPMYLGMVLTLLGIAALIGSLPFYGAALAHFLILNFVFIPFEEKKLTRIFGDQYAAYKSSTRRWI